MKTKCTTGPVSAAIISAIVMVGLLSSIFAVVPSFDVPLQEPVYRYLDMLPLPGRVNDISLSNRPFTEAQVCSLLVFAAREHRCRDTAVNNFYLRRFSKGPDGSPLRKTPARLSFDGVRTYAYPYITSSFRVQDSNYSPEGFSTFGIDTMSGNTEFCNTTGIGARIYSSIGKTLVYIDGVILTEYSTLSEWTKNDDPHFGQNWAAIGDEPSHLKGYDDFVAYVKLPIPWFDCKLGNDRVSWGYADSSGLLFSGRGKPFLQMKLDKSLGALNYTFIFGKLLGDRYKQKRVIYSKHITYTPRPWLSLGFSDQIISSNREFEPVYLMPFLPCYFSQHYIGSFDNLMMSFDGKLLIGSRWAAYGEYFLDDISNILGPLHNTSWGDKWAGFFGIKLFNPLPAAYVSAVKLEFMQMEPWVYTASSASRPDEYSYPVHFGQVLGNILGPHSRAVTLDLSCQFSKKIGGELALRQVWKGRGAGSNVFDWMYTVLATEAHTKADSVMYETKAYRFNEFDRNRTVVSARFFTLLDDWLLVNCYGDFGLERQPVPVNLFRFGLDVQLNY
jgi:hypothetical protein